MKIKILFLGTPEIAVSALKSIIKDTNFEIIGVVTNEDKKIGRNHSEPQESEVALFAKSNNFKVFKTSNINENYEEILKFGRFDFILTCAFGQILNKKILNLPTKKSLNIHASLLPKGRGGAPIHWSIINGELKTGISLMEMIPEMDAGNYYWQKEININNDETYDSLYFKLCNLIENSNIALHIKNIYNNKSMSIKQTKSNVSFWLNIKKEDSKINFNKSNIEVERQVRGLYSKPIAFIDYNGKIIKITKANLPTGNIAIPMKVFKPGEVVLIDDRGILVSCKQGYIFLNKIILPGKKENSVKDLLNGSFNIPAGTIFNYENK